MRLVQDMQALTRSVRTAVLGAMAESMHDAAETGASSLKAATGSLLRRLDQVGASVGQAEASLQRVMLWASWWLLG